MAAEIQKDVRTWKNADGATSARRASTWEEAHRVAVELEGIRAGGKALQAAYASGPGGGKGVPELAAPGWRSNRHWNRPGAGTTASLLGDAGQAQLLKGGPLQVLSRS